MYRVLLLFPAFCFSLSYEVHFVGLNDAACLKAIEESSELVSLQKRPPASINGLRYRMASDAKELINILHAFAYYDAAITTDLEKIDDQNQNYNVNVFINSGPQFPLTKYEVYHGEDCKQIEGFPNCHYSPKDLGLNLGEPALSLTIVNAELNILTELSRCGYPLASIEKRRVIVDMSDTEVEAAACIQEGPLSKFGPATIFGLKGIKTNFLLSKIGWKEGDIYNSDLVEKTQERLLKTELFSSVYVSHGDHLDEIGELPMKIRLTEAKHQKIGVGAFYGPVDGPGVTFSYLHRNIGGRGDILSARADVSWGLTLGNITYKIPDFLAFDQTYRVFAEASRENIKAYHAFIYRGGNYFDYKIDEKTNFSAGAKVEHINVSHAATDGTYLLAGLPLFIRYDNADNFLDPTKGFSIVYSATPYQSLFHSNEHFVKQRLTSTFYIPIRTPRFVLALRTQFGSIAGTERDNVPLTKLFLGGSEDELRGYRYKTVSPLNHHHKPLGGRSAIYATAEIRLKITKEIGLVPFADFGTVTNSQWPDFTAKWFKSVGGGFRYFTFFGPLRLDIGFPLNKRKIDHNFEIYGSIGQAF